MTSTTEPDDSGQILKTDKLGRVQVSPERREAILDEFERSGMTGTAFAKRYGIKYQTFASWRQKRKRNGAPIPEKSVPFLLIESEENPPRGPGSSEGLEIELPGGARLRIRSPEEAALAAELLRALR